MSYLKDAGKLTITCCAYKDLCKIKLSEPLTSCKDKKSETVSTPAALLVLKLLVMQLHLLLGFGV